MIDASPGLGESVVSGAVNPDHFVVDTATGRITERRLGDKRTFIRSLPGGGTEHVQTAMDGACLTDDQIRALAALGARVEALYGSPQDTEWAIDAGGTLWLTQARPDHHPLPDSPAHRGRLAGLLLLQPGSGALPAVDADGPVGLPGGVVLGRRAVRRAGGGPAGRRPPVQRGAAGSSSISRESCGAGWGRATVPRIFDVMEARSAKVLRGLFDDPRLSVIQRSRWPVLRRIARVLFRYRIPPRALRALLDPEAAHRQAAQIGADLRARLALPAGATAARRLDHVEQVLATEIVPLLPTVMTRAVPGFLMLGLRLDCSATARGPARCRACCAACRTT